MKLPKKIEKFKKYGYGELQSIYSETKKFCKPVSYFGFLETIENYTNNLPTLFPNYTDDFDFLTINGKEDFLIKKGYERKRLLDKITNKMGLLYEREVYLSPFYVWEKNFYDDEEEIPVQCFLNGVGAVDIREEDVEDYEILNLCITLQPGCIKEDRIRQSLSVYKLLRERDKSVYERFKEKYKTIAYRAMEKRGELYPPIREILGFKKYVMSYSESEKEVQKERNLLKNNLYGKYKKRAKTTEEEKITKEYFDILIKTLDNLLK